jgi:hypothetical protein
MCGILSIDLLEHSPNVFFNVEDKLFLFRLMSTVNVVDLLGLLGEICEVIHTFKPCAILEIIIKT